MIFKPCLHSGCPLGAEEDSAYCTEHRKQLVPRKHGPSIYRTTLHKGWAALIIRRDPICVACNRANSTDADHVVPLEDGGTWELSNGQGLCHSCHSIKTAKDVAVRRNTLGNNCREEKSAHEKIFPTAPPRGMGDEHLNVDCSGTV